MVCGLSANVGPDPGSSWEWPSLLNVRRLTLTSQTEPISPVFMQLDQCPGLNFNSWTEKRYPFFGYAHTRDLGGAHERFSLTSSGAGYYDTGEDKTKNIKAQLRFWERTRKAGGDENVSSP